MADRYSLIIIRRNLSADEVAGLYDAAVEEAAENMKAGSKEDVTIKCERVTERGTREIFGRRYTEDGVEFARSTGSFSSNS